MLDLFPAQKALDMNDRMHRDMLEATRLTRVGRLTDATALLQRRLRGGRALDTTFAAANDRTDMPAGRASPVIDLVPGTIEITDRQSSSVTLQPSGTERSGAGTAERAAGRRMAEALRNLIGRVNRARPAMPGLAEPSPAYPRGVVPDGAQFVAGSYSDRAGSRAYKLYIPSSYRRGQAIPLVVMLHGCTQSPDDFATGTRMNALAEEHTCLVVYPEQAASANASKCWNWFSPGDQRRGHGEPSLIAGITRQIMRDYSVDQRRVYVAGLSAGGAAAAIMGMTYPDLYAAIGVHSGLACGAASDLPSAFAAMRQAKRVTINRAGDALRAEGYGRSVPTIVFHGDQDTIVHPGNGDAVIARAKETTTPDLQLSVQHGRVPGGHAYSRTVQHDASGRAILEQWIIHGAGHAWSGGSPAGSYTDPRGPDAAREMLRFFLDQPLQVE
jgi:poly(hydroxyalkanoate) depolymerase family esterase